MNKVKNLNELLDEFTKYLLTKYTDNESSEKLNKTLNDIFKSVKNHTDYDLKKLMKSTSDSYSIDHQRDQHGAVRSPKHRLQPKSSAQQSPQEPTKVNFMKDLRSLKDHNPDLGRLLSKCDIGNNVGSVYLDYKGHNFFNIRESKLLGEYTLINCFLSFMIGFIYGENRSEFLKFCKRLNRGKFKSLEGGDAGKHATFKEVISTLVRMKERNKEIEEMLVYLKERISEDQQFNESLILGAKEALRDFLDDLKRRNSESFRNKYYMVEKLIFEDSMQIKSNQEMYKILRYCTEGFFLTFDSFCELIFLKKVENDYLLKKIFINRGRNTTNRKHKFFLVQIDDKFCLFTNFKINTNMFTQFAQKAKNDENGGAVGPEHHIQNDLPPQDLHTAPLYVIESNEQGSNPSQGEAAQRSRDASANKTGSKEDRFGHSGKRGGSRNQDLDGGQGRRARGNSKSRDRSTSKPRMPERRPSENFSDFFLRKKNGVTKNLWNEQIPDGVSSGHKRDAKTLNLTGKSNNPYDQSGRSGSKGPATNGGNRGPHGHSVGLDSNQNHPGSNDHNNRLKDMTAVINNNLGQRISKPGSVANFQNSTAHNDDLGTLSGNGGIPGSTHLIQGGFGQRQKVSTTPTHHQTGGNNGHNNHHSRNDKYSEHKMTSQKKIDIGGNSKIKSSKKRYPRWTYDEPSNIRAKKVVTTPLDHNRIMGNHNKHLFLNGNQGGPGQALASQQTSIQNTVVDAFPLASILTEVDGVLNEMEMNTRKISLIKKFKFNGNGGADGMGPGPGVHNGIAKHPELDRGYSIKVTSNTVGSNMAVGFPNDPGLFQKLPGPENPATAYNRVPSNDIALNLGRIRKYGNIEYMPKNASNNEIQVSGMPPGPAGGPANKPPGFAQPSRRMDGIERRAATYRRVGRSHDIATRSFGAGGTETYRMDRVSVQRQNSHNNVNPLAMKPFGASTLGANYQYQNSAMGAPAPPGNGIYSYRFSNTADLSSNPGAKVIGRNRYY